MPTYEYRCPECGNEHSESLTISEYERCRFNYECGCGTLMVRVFSFSVKPMMPEHLNSTTGQVVRSERDFRDQLKRQSEAETVRTGIEHNYVPVDIQDRKTLGVTAEGLDATYNRRRKLGMKTNDAMKISD